MSKEKSKAAHPTFAEQCESTVALFCCPEGEDVHGVFLAFEEGKRLNALEHEQGRLRRLVGGKVGGVGQVAVESCERAERGVVALTFAGLVQPHSRV